MTIPRWQLAQHIVFKYRLFVGVIITHVNYLFSSQENLTFNVGRRGKILLLAISEKQTAESGAFLMETIHNSFIENKRNSVHLLETSVLWLIFF